MEEEVVLPIGTKIIIKKTPWRTSKSEFGGHLVTIISLIYSESYEETLYKIGWEQEDNPYLDKPFDPNVFWWDIHDFELPTPPNKPLKGGLPLW